MKFLVTGSSGMLGTEVCPRLSKMGHQVVTADLNPLGDRALRLDICDGFSVDKILTREKPDWVFHLAAETNVDLCEEKPEHAFRVNVLGTENVALSCQKYGISMAYISTAGVFDGEKREPYIDYDPPNPINIYGQTKWAGEKAVREMVPRHFIFRAGWMVGGWNIDKKFVYKIVQQILSGSRVIKAVNDKFGNPTFTSDFAANMIEVVLTGRYGLYHLCGTGSCSRYDVACKIVEYMGMNGDVRVEAVSSDAFPLPASRPRSEMMQNLKLDLLGLNRMSPWQQALKNYITSNVNKGKAAVSA